MSSYTIKQGDTLAELAKNNNVSVSDLLSWNKIALDRAAIARGLLSSLNGAKIFPGTVITLSPPSEKIMLPGPVGHITEFIDKFDIPGHWTGTCGETALAVAMAASRGFIVTPEYIDCITDEMVSRNLVAANGASKILNLSTFAQSCGYPIVYQHNETPGWSITEWRQKLRNNAGVNPIVLQICDAQHLIDVETSISIEAQRPNVWHMIAIVGKQDNGYICSDGDHPQANERHQIYTIQTLQAANPGGMLIVKMLRKV